MERTKQTLVNYYIWFRKQSEYVINDILASIVEKTNCTLNVTKLEKNADDYENLFLTYLNY